MTLLTAKSDQGYILVEVRTTDSMGKGLFAVEDIPRGTQIFAEAPIIAASNPPRTDREYEDTDDIAAFCSALRKMPKSEWKKLDELYCNTTHITSERRTKVRSYLKGESVTDDHGVVLRGKKLQDYSNAATKRLAIFLTNGVQMGYGGEYGIGVFALYSRINHSCVPNVHNSYKPGSERLTVYATRDIRAGEQITTSYLDSPCRTRRQRQNDTLNTWGFLCMCSACTDPSTEPVRSRMFDLDQKLAAYGSFLGRISGITAADALEYAEELAELLKAQGLQGMELGHAYRDCSKFSRELRMMAKALDYAHKELEVERWCIGTETAHLEKDMDGAEYWLAHLQRLSGRGSTRST